MPNYDPNSNDYHYPPRHEPELADINRQSPGDAQCHVTLMLARAERAEARVVELEARNKHMETVLYDAQVLLGTEDIGELITGPTGPISRLIARAERAEVSIAELEKSAEKASFLIGLYSARAERAEAQLAEAKAGNA